MPFKINLSDKKGKTWKLEVESEDINGKELNDKIQGKEIRPDLEGYEFEITGASDLAGFTCMKEIQGVSLSKMLLGFGKGMHKRSRKEGKKKRSNFKPDGLRIRKTVRGRVMSPAISQINMKLLKEGSKPLAEIFPEQNQPKAEAAAKK